MKLFTFSTIFAALILLSNTSIAQRSELGLSGGFMYHTGAGGSIYYKANKGGMSAIGGLTFLANLQEVGSESKIGTQLGISATVQKLANKSTDTFRYWNALIGNDDKKFQYANLALTITPVLNITYKLSDWDYVYGGVAAGVIASRNSSNKSYAEVVDKDKNYTYTAPDGGLGFCGGIHGGYTRRLTQRFAVNAEVAVRYYSLGFSVDDSGYPGGSSFNYTTIAIPVTVGIRYRMGWEKELINGKYRPVPEDLE